MTEVAWFLWTLLPPTSGYFIVNMVYTKTSIYLNVGKRRDIYLKLLNIATLV